MRYDCPIAVVAAAGFDHDHRFQSCRGPQPAEKGPGIGHALDVQQDTAGAQVQGQVVQHLPEAHVRRGAQGSHRGKPEAAGVPPVQQRGTEGAGLGDHGHLTGGDLALGKTGVEPGTGPDDPEAVGAYQGDFVGPGDVDDLVLHRLAGGADLGEAGGDDHHRPHALLPAFAHDLGDGRRGYGDDHQIDRLPDVADGGVAAQAVEGGMRRVDGKKLTLVVTVDEF